MVYMHWEFYICDLSFSTLLICALSFQTRSDLYLENICVLICATLLGCRWSVHRYRRVGPTKRFAATLWALMLLGIWIGSQQANPPRRRYLVLVCGSSPSL